MANETLQQLTRTLTLELPVFTGLQAGAVMISERESGQIDLTVKQGAVSVTAPMLRDDLEQLIKLMQSMLEPVKKGS